MSNSFSILGVMPTVPGAVSGDLPTFTTNGIVQDSGYSVNSSVLGGSNTTIPTSYVVLQAIGGAITSSKSFRGGYDASSNLFPATGGSGAAGAILSGDVWNITVNGTLGGEAVVVGNTILALVDTPGQTAGNWLISNTLTDVIITSPTPSQYVRYNGSAWVNSVILSGDLPLATGSVAGAVSTAAQTFAGAKTFQNLINANSFFPHADSTASTGGTITLTNASNQIQLTTGTLTETYVLPDATTLNPGAYFIFNNNSSGGSVTVNANGGGLVATVSRGAWVEVILLTNSTSAGTWDYHAYLPSGAIFGNTGLTFSGGTVSFANGNFSATTNQVTLGASAHQTIINAPAPSGASVTFTIPNAAATNSIQPLGSATSSNWVQYIGADGVQHLAAISAGDLPPVTNLAGGLLGSLPYQSAAGTTLFVLPNTTTTKKVLKETGTGSAGQAPELEQATVAECSDYTTTTNFTPTLINTTPGDLAITYTVQNGRYVKIGNVCFVNIFILTSSFTHTTSTGAWQISGLPIAAANNGQQAIGTCAVQGVTKAGYTQFFGEIDTGSSVVVLAASGSGVGYSTISGNSQMPTGGTVLIDLSITYFI